MEDWLFRLKDVEGLLPDPTAESRVKYVLRHGSMKAGLYAPIGQDPQGPHKQDELYLVASGRGKFVKNGAVKAFGPNDLIFVEAGAEHRFFDFTEDFSVWVIFWGPDGGEA